MPTIPTATGDEGVAFFLALKIKVAPCFNFFQGEDLADPILAKLPRILYQ